MDPDQATIDAYIVRKKMKGVWAQPKTRKRGGQPVLTGICPCRKCHHNQPMIMCDPGFNDCQCCADWCS